jgi:sugar phosphate isomerase/epimerase
MIFNISALIAGMNKFEEVAMWINECKDPVLGVELIAFTHDQLYWESLVALLPKLTCPVSFHGPYIGVEATSQPGSKEQAWLLASYERVFELAARHKVTHVVFHYSQLSFQEEQLKQAKDNAWGNIDKIMHLANSYHVNCVIENLCQSSEGRHLFTNEEYFKVFREKPTALSLIDIGHANVNGLNIDAFITEFGSRVRAFHFHNNDGKRDLHNDIYSGTVDYTKIIRMVKKYCPEAVVVLEYEPHTNLSHQELLDEINQLKQS